jgi:hypothetical protein
MVCSGMTTIELVRQNSLLPDEQMFDFSFDTISDNLFIIFGTHKIIRILSPSLRALPLSGIEWSFVLKDERFDEDGYRIVDPDEEENGNLIQN